MRASCTRPVAGIHAGLHVARQGDTPVLLRAAMRASCTLTGRSHPCSRVHLLANPAESHESVPYG